MGRIALPPQQPGDGGDGSREWSDLPDVALFCISQRLPNFVDYLSFSATCRAWHSVAKAGQSCFLASQPPLLCNAIHLYSPLQENTYTNKLLAGAGPRRTRVINFCHGHFVVQDGFSVTYRKHDVKLRLVHPIDGASAAAIPEFQAYHLSWVVLTAPPGSPDCVVVACCQTLHETIVHRRLGGGSGDPGWSFRWYPRDEELVRPAASGGKVYAWSRKRWGVVILEFLPGGHLKETTVELQRPEYHQLPQLFPRHLAASSAGVLLVEFYLSARPDGETVMGRAVVYRLDEPGRKLERMRSLGGRAVLVAERGGCVVSEQPGQWGGEGDKVYVYSYTLGCTIAMDYLEKSADYRATGVPAPLWPGSISTPSFWALMNTCC